jgi:hypothetical protein
MIGREGHSGDTTDSHAFLYCEMLQPDDASSRKRHLRTKP